MLGDSGKRFFHLKLLETHYCSFTPDKTIPAVKHGGVKHHVDRRNAFHSAMKEMSKNNSKGDVEIPHKVLWSWAGLHCRPLHCPVEPCKGSLATPCAFQTALTTTLHCPPDLWKLKWPPVSPSAPRIWNSNIWRAPYNIYNFLIRHWWMRYFCHGTWSKDYSSKRY